ncbi:MAG: hypothetical protein AB7J13_00575 [Pyrinomonadaceae bacterium]
MYCPNCGNTVNKKLKYCNSCGERLSKSVEIDKDGMPGKMLDNILTTLFLVVMFGLGILVGLVAVLLGNDVRIEPVVVIILAYLAAIFGICFTLVKQATKLIDHRLQASQDPDQHSSRHELPRRVTAQLDEYREPAASVVDHTTKILNKVPVERG